MSALHYTAREAENATEEAKTRMRKIRRKDGN